MVNRVKSMWLNLWQSLWFLPGLIVLAFAILGIELVKRDGHHEVSVHGVVEGWGRHQRSRNSRTARTNSRWYWKIPP